MSFRNTNCQSKLVRWHIQHSENVAWLLPVTHISKKGTCLFYVMIDYALPCTVCYLHCTVLFSSPVNHIAWCKLEDIGPKEYAKQQNSVASQRLSSQTNHYLVVLIFLTFFIFSSQLSPVLIVSVFLSSCACIKLICEQCKEKCPT